MYSVTPSDVLRALKKFKRLAKQDLLASELTSEPEFWREQAEARRATYDALMALVESEGVEAAHRYAIDEHASLPLLGSEGETAKEKGKRQALQMFLAVLGVEQSMTSDESAAAGVEDEQMSLEASS